MVAAPIVDDAVSAVLADLEATRIAVEHETAGAVRLMAQNRATLEIYTEVPPDVFAMAVAEDVQQWLHDTFQDTSWPVCPTHGNHPLWLARDGEEPPKWRCLSNGQVFGILGRLTTR